MQNLLNDLRKTLQGDNRLIIDGELVKNKIVELALAMDEGLLTLLLSNVLIKHHFFKDINGVLVFDKVAFQSFVSNKQFLPDSYTAFKNKIGLTANGDYLTESKEVVLAWPYKDCILEGGQIKEDQKRKEIFWNETLAPDEIDRLLAPKVLTNFKKYDKNGEHEVDEISLDENLIIKGNNLFALHSLKKQYAGKVKLIYIDPPYNTGSDSFGYNDSFNHSTWLTFMRNRLEVAKEFLREDGAIFISIDENEIGYIQVLLDEIFGKACRCNIITVKRGSVTGHKSINPGVVNITEYVISYSKNYNSWIPNRLFKKRGRNDRYNNFIKYRNKGIENWEFCSLLDAFSEFRGIPKAKIKKEMAGNFEEHIFQFIKDNKDSVIQFAYPDKNKVSLEAKQLIDTSLSNPKNIFHLARANEPDIYLKNGQRLLFYADRLKEIDGELVTAEPMSDLWDDVLPNDLHNEGKVTLRKGKKPEKLISRIIGLSSSEGDLVLDFHLGSGTAAAVALKMKRKFIGIEQLDYGKDDSVVRLNNTISGEQSGISKSVNWSGGGSFTYCELAQYNANIIDKIEQENTAKGLESIWQMIEEYGFISYKVRPEVINENSHEFQALTIEEQKRFLIAVLDKNQIYVNYSEIEDEDYQISKADIKLNKKFYGEA